MTFAHRTSVFLISVTALAYGQVAVAQTSPCESPQLVAPAAATVYDARPSIEWSPVAGAAYYRIRVQSKVPEGKTLATFDTQVTETRFRSPQPLTDYRARVYVQVTAQCVVGAETLSSSEANRRFDIEPPVECKLVRAPTASTENGGLVVRWPPVTSAVSYRITAFAGVDGRLAATHEVRDNVLKLNIPLAGIGVIAVQPRCGSHWGTPAYGTVSAPALDRQ